MELYGFLAAAACALVSAVFVVRGSNLIHAALWLGGTLIATAALYAILGATFLAGVQILLYVGGVITLMLFGIMITRRHEGIVVLAGSENRGIGLQVSLALFGVMIAAIVGTPELELSAKDTPVGNTATIGRSILGEHVLAFEVLSLLLLAVMVGAIVIARRRDPGEVKGTPSRAPARGAEVPT